MVAGVSRGSTATPGCDRRERPRPRVDDDVGRLVVLLALCIMDKRARTIKGDEIKYASVTQYNVKWP